MWGATVAPIYTGFSEVSWQMYEMVETNFGNTSHDVFSYPPRDHLVLPNAAFKLDVICILTPRSNHFSQGTKALSLLKFV